MLRIRGLVAGYEDGGRVLESIDLQVAAGESVALMGRNGMGKTTLLRAVMGLLRPVAGGVTFDGSDLTGRPPFEISNAGIAYVPQGREIFKDFTVEENLRLGLLGKTGMAARVPDAIYGRFPILAERHARAPCPAVSSSSSPSRAPSSVAHACSCWTSPARAFSLPSWRPSRPPCLPSPGRKARACCSSSRTSTSCWR